MQGASFLRGRSASLRRLAVGLALELAALLVTTGCGGSLAGAEAPSAPAAADVAASPPPGSPPAPPPPPATGGSPDMAAMYQPQAAPPGDSDAKNDSAQGAPAPAQQAAPGATAPAPAAAGPKTTAPPKAAAANTPPSKTPSAPGKAGDKTPPAPPASPAGAPLPPLLIYVGELAMVVADEPALPQAIDRIIDTAEALGGYLAGRKDTSVQVRIPSYRFREGLIALEKIAEVTHRSVTADDVSEQYSDLEVRLSNLKATQKRLQEFLAKAGSIPEMLTVGRELERVAGEIEAIEGKMRYLRSRAAFSLVTVNLSTKPKVTAVAKVETPLPHEVTLPIEWLPRVGLDTLLNLPAPPPEPR